jgi:hypothetical protein
MFNSVMIGLIALAYRLRFFECEMLRVSVMMNDGQDGEKVRYQDSDDYGVGFCTKE